MFKNIYSFLEPEAYNPEVFDAIIRHPHTPPEFYVSLAHSSHTRLKVAAADSVFCPPAALEVLASENTLSFSERLARNPNTPPNTLEKIYVEAFNVGVKKMVLSNPSAPPNVFFKCVGDKNFSLFKTISTNPSCPPEILSVLASPQNLSSNQTPEVSQTVQMIQKSLAANPSTPPETLEFLYRNCALPVITSVLQHPLTPLKVLQDALNQNNQKYPYHLAKNPSCSTSMLLQLAALHEDPYTVCSVAANPSCSPGLLYDLVTSTQDPYVLEAAALNPSCPPKVASILLGSKYHTVRLMLAANDSLPSEALENLAFDPDTTVRLKVLQNPNASFALKAAFIRDIDQSILPSSIISDMYQNFAEHLATSDISVDFEILKKVLLFIESNTNEDFDRASVALSLRHLLKTRNCTGLPGYVSFTQYVLEVSDTVLKTPPLNVLPTRGLKNRATPHLGF